MFETFGMLLVYFLGIEFGDFQFSYSQIAMVGVVLMILFLFLMLVATYESPRWLFSKNMDYNGTRTLNILRGKKYPVAEEINEIKGKLKEKSNSIVEQFLAFRHRDVYHPFILAILLTFFLQFSGNIAVQSYASQIFTQAGYSEEKAKLASLGAVGVVRLLSIIVSTFLVDCVGRKVLLVFSGFGVTVSSSIFGMYFFVLEGKCNGSLSFPDCPNGLEYVAFACMILFNAAYCVGWAPLVSTIRVEILPNQVRALGNSIACTFTWHFAFIVTLSFHPYTALVTPKFTWWTFALIMVVSIVFVALFVPETKGRSLEKIQEHFEMGNVLACSLCVPKKDLFN